MILYFDGHSLDLDDDFAFSMHATREDWEKEQRDYAELSASVEANMKRRE